MSSDYLSIWLTVASFILGPLTLIMVGTQTREDARSITLWSLTVLVPMLLVGGARLTLRGHQSGLLGGPGMVMLCTVLIASLWLGYRIAALRDAVAQAAGKGKKVDQVFRDDELA